MLERAIKEAWCFEAFFNQLVAPKTAKIFVLQNVRYLLFFIWIEQIQSRLIYIFIDCKLQVYNLGLIKFAQAE